MIVQLSLLGILAVATLALLVTRVSVGLLAVGALITLGPFVAMSLSAFKVSDEVAILVTVLAASWHLARERRRPAAFPGQWWFAGFVVLGLVSTLVRSVPLNVAFVGFADATKAVVLGIAVAQLPIRVGADRNSDRVLRMGGYAAAALLVVGVALNLAFPDFWFSHFSVGTGSERGGISSPVSFFTHPGYLAQAANLVALAFVVSLLRNPAQKASRVAIVLATVATGLATLRRKALLALVIAAIAVAQAFRRGTWKFVLAGAVVVAIAGVALRHQIVDHASLTWNQYFVTKTAPRTQLYLGSWTMATDYFPFGAGFGRFGTAAAMDYYSPEYLRLAFPTYYGLEPNGPYGQDAFWPGVLGETGFFGLAAYATGILLMLRRALGSVLPEQGRPHLSSRNAAIAFLCLGWWCEYLVESVATPVYLAAPLGPLLFALFGYAESVRRAPETTT